MKILITGAWPCEEDSVFKLKKMGHEVLFHQDEKEMVNPIGCMVDAVICNALFVYNDINKFKNLKIIQLTSAGLDRVPLEKIQERDIKLYNARGVYSIPMAEFAVGGVLQLYKQSCFFNENKKLKKWEKCRDVLELYKKQVCIVGCGSVGTECAKRFKAFGCEVFGIDVVPFESDFYDKMVSLNELDEVLKGADIVVLTLPLTEETVHLFDESRFDAMKNGSVLVNIARGKIVSEKDLIKALDEKLYGAVLDVFEQEPLPCESLLWNMPNVIITPHNSFVGDSNSERLFDVICKNLERGLET